MRVTTYAAHAAILAVAFTVTGEQAGCVTTHWDVASSQDVHRARIEEIPYAIGGDAVMGRVVLLLNGHEVDARAIQKAPGLAIADVFTWDNLSHGHDCAHPHVYGEAEYALALRWGEEEILWPLGREGQVCR